MKNYPAKINAYHLCNAAAEDMLVQAKLPGCTAWVPARHLGYPSLWRRFALAWLVFTGRADALHWPGQ